MENEQILEIIEDLFVSDDPLGGAPLNPEAQEALTNNILLTNPLTDLDSVDDEAFDVNEAVTNLKSNIDALFDTSDIQDPLTGAWSASEFLDYDRFMDRLDELESTLDLSEVDTAPLNIDEWIGDLVANPDKIKFIPITAGTTLEYTKTMAPNKRNIFKLDREHLYNYVKSALEDKVNKRYYIDRRISNLRLDKEHFALFSSKYLLNYINHRRDNLLPWAIGDTGIGFVACPSGYRVEMFNMQDGYYNASFMSRHRPRKVYEWLRTMEARLLIKTTAERFEYNDMPMIPVYRLPRKYIEIQLAHTFHGHLDGITFKDLNGVFIHPTLVESFSRYIGTHETTMPCVNYLHHNPVRYVHGGSWWLYQMGALKPKYPARIQTSSQDVRDVVEDDRSHH